MNFSPRPIPAGETINFVSSNNSIVSIDNFDETSGLLTISGNSAGTATITATYGSASAMITVNVTEAPLNIFIDDTDFDDNDNYTLSSTSSSSQYVSDTNVEKLGYVLNKEGYHITATSSDDSVCTVSVTENESENYKRGYITLTGISNGTARITLTADDENDTSMQFGVNVVSEWIKLEVPFVNPTLGYMEKIPTIKGAGFFAKLFSDNTEATVMSITQGEGTAVISHDGTATDTVLDTDTKLTYQNFSVAETGEDGIGSIKVTHGDIARTFDVLINEAYEDMYAVTGNETATVAVGSTTPIIQPQLTMPMSALLTYTSSDDTVATVDDVYNGTVRGVSAGTATFTVDNNGQATATVTVTVTSE